MAEFSAALRTEPLLLILVAVLAVAGIAMALRALHRARSIENLPTSRIRSAAQGYVELRGNARLMEGPPIEAPLSRARCCWWSYRVEERRTVVNDGSRRRRWEMVESGSSDDLFLLTDGADSCIVDPVGASVTPSVRHSWYGSTRRPERGPKAGGSLLFANYRYTEAYVPVGASLYVTGWFRTQSAVQTEHHAAEVRDRLAGLKRDRRDLLRRFDRNRDGRIDDTEWSEARAQVDNEVRRDLAEQRALPALHVLCRPPDRRAFLLSCRSEAELLRSLRWQALAWLTGGLAAAALALSAVR